MTDEQVRAAAVGGPGLESTGLVAAVAFVVVLALFGFLRLDAWTKGYLTGGLAVGGRGRRRGRGGVARAGVVQWTG